MPRNNNTNNTSTLANPLLEKQMIAWMYQQQPGSLSDAMNLQKQNFYSLDNNCGSKQLEQFISMVTMYSAVIQTGVTIKASSKSTHKNDYFFNNDDDDEDTTKNDQGKFSSVMTNRNNSTNNNKGKNENMIFTLMELRYLLLQKFSSAQLLKTNPAVRSYLLNCCQNAYDFAK